MRRDDAGSADYVSAAHHVARRRFVKLQPGLMSRTVDCLGQRVRKVGDQQVHVKRQRLLTIPAEQSKRSEPATVNGYKLKLEFPDRAASLNKLAAVSVLSRAVSRLCVFQQRLRLVV